MSKDKDNKVSDTDSSGDKVTDEVANAGAESQAASPKKSSGKPETAKILDEISRNTSAKSGKGSKVGRRPGKSPGSAARFFSLLILMLPLLAVIAYLAWQQLQLQQTLASLEQQNQQLGTTLASQESQLQQLQQRPPPEVPDNSAALEALSERLNSQFAGQLQQLRQQLAQVQSSQVSQTADVDFSWKLFEAEYLLTIANQKLLLEADVDSAIALAEQADAALVASEHSGAFAVRQALADEVGALRNAERVDQDGIYLRLENLAANVGDLDLLNSMRENFALREAQQSVPVELGTTSQGWWNSTLDFLGEIFVWRRWDERPEAMLAPGQETLIKLNLRLSLKQAQLALLARDQQQFQQTLAETRAIMQRYAVTDSAAGQALAGELNRLAQLDINPPLPTLNETLNRVRQLADSER